MVSYANVMAAAFGPHDRKRKRGSVALASGQLQALGVPEQQDAVQRQPAMRPLHPAAPKLH